MMSDIENKTPRIIKAEPSYQNLNGGNDELKALTDGLSKVTIDEDGGRRPQPAQRVSMIRVKREHPVKSEEKNDSGNVPPNARGPPGPPNMGYYNVMHPPTVQNQIHYPQMSGKRQNSEFICKVTDGKAMHLADRYRQDMIARNPPFNGFGLERQPVEHTDPSANSGYYNPIPASNQQYYNIPPPQAPMNPMRPNKVPTAEPRPAPAGQWTGADLGDVGNLLTTLTTPENPGLVTTTTPLRTQPEYVNMHTFSNGNGYMDNVGNSRSSSSPASAYQVPSPVSSVHSQNGAPSQAYSPHSQQGYNSSPSPHMMYPYSPSNQSSVASPGSQQNVPSPSNHFNGEISPGSDQNTMYGAPPFSSDTKQFGDNNPSFNSLGLDGLMDSGSMEISDIRNYASHNYQNMLDSPYPPPNNNMMGWDDRQAPAAYPHQDYQHYPNLRNPAATSPKYINITGDTQFMPPPPADIPTTVMASNLSPEVCPNYVNMPPTSIPSVPTVVNGKIAIAPEKKKVEQQPAQQMIVFVLQQPPVEKAPAKPRAIQPKPAEGVTETSTAPKKETGKKPRKTKKATKKKETEGAAKQAMEQGGQVWVDSSFLRDLFSSSYLGQVRPGLVMSGSGRNHYASGNNHTNGRYTNTNTNTNNTQSSRVHAQRRRHPYHYNPYNNPDGTQKSDRQLHHEANSRVAASTDEQLKQRNENGETVLHTAIQKRNLYLVTAIIAAAYKRPALIPLINHTNSRGQTPLFMLMTSGIDTSGKVTQLLVQSKADCNALCPCENGAGGTERISVLHYVSKYGNRCLNELKTVLASGHADVNLNSSEGVTPLHLALWNHGQTDIKAKSADKKVDSTQVVKTLLEAGANCHSEDRKSGKTALHFAVETGSLEMTRLILDNCSVPETLIDKQNYDRRTPLHVAVLLHSLSEDNKIDLVKYLIDRGASKTVRDKDKHTPQSLVQPSQIKLCEVFGGGVGSPAASLYTDEDSYASPIDPLSP